VRRAEPETDEPGADDAPRERRERPGPDDVERLRRREQPYPEGDHHRCLRAEQDRGPGWHRSVAHGRAPAPTSLAQAIEGKQDGHEDVDPHPRPGDRPSLMEAVEVQSRRPEDEQREDDRRREGDPGLLPGRGAGGENDERDRRPVSGAHERRRQRRLDRPGKQVIRAVGEDEGRDTREQEKRADHQKRCAHVPWEARFGTCTPFCKPHAPTLRELRRPRYIAEHPERVAERRPSLGPYAVTGSR
jgi:hypothetical protein